MNYLVACMDVINHSTAFFLEVELKFDHLLYNEREMLKCEM